MRKILITYIPASLFLAFLAMGIFTLGGCGGDGVGETQQVPANATLTGLSIIGPSSMNESGTATYTATASWSDDSTTTVTPDWSVNAQMASISLDGVLSCHGGIDRDQTVAITATYSSGGIVETANMDVTITNNTKTLTGLSINGWSSISEYSTNTYTATASWSDNSKSTVAPTWSVNSQMASISPYGVFSCQEEIASDQMVTITANYSSGGITKTATMDVTIENFAGILPIPPFDRFKSLSGIFFDEKVDAEGKYESSLYMFHEDSFEQYIYENPPDTSNYVTGTWSINSSGEAILSYVGGKTITWKLLDPWIITWISVDDGTGTPSIVDLEIAGPGPFPFESSFIHGTYVNQYGDTWVFNSNGTGSTTSDGGSTFTWFVDHGLLKIVFPNGYVGLMYEPVSSRPTLSPTILRFAILKYTQTGDFSSYEGGMQLTPQ